MLMRILTTQIKPTAGEAYVFGLDVIRQGGKIIALTVEKGASKSELASEIQKLNFVKEVFVENGNLNVFVYDAESALPNLMNFLNFLKSESVPVDKVSITKPFGRCFPQICRNKN
jgi:ABC-type multidrug transport system ATPase subunit